MTRNHIIIGGAIVAAIVIGVLAFLYSNKNVSNAPPAAITENNPVATAVPFTKIAEGTQAAISTRTNYLITSADQLNQLWKIIGATSTPPEIDFGNDSVIAVFAGDKSISAIAVANVEDANSRMVSVTLAKMAGNCASKLKPATPYEIVSLPATTLPFMHEDIVATTSCSQS